MVTIPGNPGVLIPEQLHLTRRDIALEIISWE